MNYNLYFSWVLFVLFLVACSTNSIKVVCIGDSITEGYGLADPENTAYPAILDSLLGKKYSVFNCGRSGTTLQKDGDFPYWLHNEFFSVFDLDPDIIVIKLGTNDSKYYNWNATTYEKDYQAMIDTLNTISSKPKIYLCFPVPAYRTVWGINDSTITYGIIPIIKKLASKNDLQVIDLYNPMCSQPESFPDGIHPNERGAKNMAIIVAEELIK